MHTPTVSKTDIQRMDLPVRFRFYSDRFSPSMKAIIPRAMSEIMLDISYISSDMRCKRCGPRIIPSSRKAVTSGSFNLLMTEAKMSAPASTIDMLRKTFIVI